MDTLVKNSFLPFWAQEIDHGETIRRARKMQQQAEAEDRLADVAEFVVQMDDWAKVDTTGNFQSLELWKTMTDDEKRDAAHRELTMRGLRRTYTSARWSR